MSSDGSLQNEYVSDFIRKIVLEKYGNQIDKSFLEQEANRLYEVFESDLFYHFEKMSTQT